MKSLFSTLLPGLLLSGIVNFQVMAETTGTQTFTAAIATDTCTLVANTAAVTFPRLLISDLKNSPVGGSAMEESAVFNIVHCPASQQSIKVTATYALDGVWGDGYARDYAHPAFSGSANGFILTVYRSTSPKDERWLEGRAYSYEVTNGAVDVPVTIGLGLTSKPGRTELMTPGTFNSNITFEFDFS